MTPSEFRIGTVPRTVTAVTSGFELHADTEFERKLFRQNSLSHDLE